jgi:hypothetical protein
LKLDPYRLHWGVSVYARVAAINLVGQSGWSDDGNGAVLLTLPNAPFNLVDVPAVTNKDQIRLSWLEASTYRTTIGDEGPANGGTSVLDFRIFIQDETAGSAFSELVSNHPTSSYTATSLITGHWYNFKV